MASPSGLAQQAFSKIMEANDDTATTTDRELAATVAIAYGVVAVAEVLARMDSRLSEIEEKLSYINGSIDTIGEIMSSSGG